MNSFAKDDKVQAMISLLEDIRAYPYADDTKKVLLNQLDRHAIPYLLDELPEGLTYKFYTDKLDEYVVKLIKKEIK